MRKFFRSIALAIGLTAALGAAPSPAAQIPLGVVGMNYGGDPTITTGFPYATGVYPNYTTFDRIYDSIRGATAHPTWWSTLNPSAGTYLFTTLLDPILTVEASHGKVTEYTLSGVPSYVNASQKVVGGTQLTQFSTFLTAMMAHVAGNNQCFGYFSLWNEVNQPSTFWTGTAADMATFSAVAYPIIKAACPHTVVLSASTTSGVDTGSSPNPNGPFQYLNAYLAACATGCFDAVNVHGYPQVPSLQTANTSVMYAPELLANTVTNAQSVAVANGFSPNIYLDEGYACSDPASTTFPANTRAYASCQATQLVIAAFNGVKSYANSFFGDGCAIPACGNEFFSGGPRKLTPAGVVKGILSSWFAGASTSGSFFRGAGSNLITVAPNDASVATGNIGGSGGGGCPSPPAGTGSLPVGASPWGLSATASIAGGMSYYVVGSGTSGSQPYLDVRECGTDASGANSDSIRMNNFTGAATVGQNVVISACLGLAAGTLSGIQEIDLQINEYAAGPTYANEFMVQGQIQPVSTALVPITGQCFETRYVMHAPTAAFAVPYILVKHYGSVAIDATIRIGRPRLDVNATRWSGVITKAGGYSATIAEDASGSGSITAPVGSIDYRDAFGGVYPTTGGATIPLTNSPILIENIAQTAYFPSLSAAPGFFVAPTLGGSDSFPGTIAQPFATLNRCHSAMQASGTTRLCYVRGAVTTANWTCGSNETWRNYPGDPAYSTNITLTGTDNGCSSVTNITIKNLVINGTSTTPFTSMFLFAPAAINFWSNHVTMAGGGFNAFNLNNANIQGNTWTAPTTGAGNQISLNLTNNDNLDHSNVVVSDEEFIGGGSIVLQAQTQGSVSKLHNYHLDRLYIHDYGDPAVPSFGIDAISWVGPHVANDHVTLYGNTITQPSGNTKPDAAFEIGIGNVTAQNNTTNYQRFTYNIGVGGNFLGNVAIPQTGFTNVFGGTSEYDATLTWLGSNTVSGVLRTGCVTGLGGCVLSPTPTGSMTTLWAPSAVFIPSP